MKYMLYSFFQNHFSAIMKVPPIVQALSQVKLHTKTYISRPWYEWALHGPAYVMVLLSVQVNKGGTGNPLTFSMLSTLYPFKWRKDNTFGQDITGRGTESVISEFLVWHLHVSGFTCLKSPCLRTPYLWFQCLRAPFSQSMCLRVLI